MPIDINNEVDVFVRELDFPTLGVNYVTGAPGSYFTLTGAGSLVTDTITVTVNSQAIGTIPVTPDGSYEFILSTAGADVGHYTVGVVAPFADEVAVFWLDPQDPIRPMEGSGSILLVVPPGIAQHLRFFPVLQTPLGWP